MGLPNSKGVLVQRTYNHHTQILNYLADTFNLQSYLEIGVQRRENNFDKIRARFKICVDPDPEAKANFLGTSDEFFSKQIWSGGLVPGAFTRFDLIFIDGLHHADQVQKDFDSSMFHLRDGGFIVLHDTAPECEEVTSVPRIKKGRWLGDVYKFICKLNTYKGIDFRTLDFDNGITVVWMDETKERLQVPDVDFNYYWKNRHLLRIATFEELEAIIEPLKQAV